MSCRFSALCLLFFWVAARPLDMCAQHPDEVAVVTFNIRYDNPDDPVVWDVRKETVVGSVSYFDILGFQEALAHQQDFLVASLPEHDHYGVGRDDGARRGEHCPLFWRRDRFDLLHAETLWLSETPQVPGSIGWDAELPRIATVVLLHDRQTEQVFRVINTHFSHIGKEAQQTAAQMLSARFSESQAEVNLLLGDFNVAPQSVPFGVLTSGRMEDAYTAADKRCRSGQGTYTGFPTSGLRGAPRIDHIFVDGGDVLWYCLEERILEGYYMSDHLPVYIALKP